MIERRTLDWRPNFDQRSVMFRFAALDCWSNGSTLPSIRRRKTVYLDQGREGACTGFGEEHVRALGPFPQPTSNGLARNVYEEARRQDEWPGEDYEGSSVNGAMKAARQMGLIRKWRWAYTLQEAKHGVSFHGGGELGIWWWTGMFNTDSSGFVHLKGSREGGHALAYAGYRRINGAWAHRLENSWGEDWGDHGGCWIWEEEFKQLLTDDGELAFPLKVRP